MKSLFFALMFCASTAFGGCLQFEGNLLESFNCTGLPTIDKYYQPSTFKWKGREYLAVNRGNELNFYNITTTPGAPLPHGGTRFHVGNQGDSNHDLVSFSICDDCRFGVAAYKKGTVIFDLGTGDDPRIPSVNGWKFYPPTSGEPSRMTFSYRAMPSQYVISKDLPNPINGKVTVYRIDSVTTLTPIMKFPYPPGAFHYPVSRGFDRGTYLWLALGSGEAIYSYRKSGENLVYVSDTRMRGALSVRGNRAVTGQSGAIANGLKLWDVTDPCSARELFTYAGKYRTVSYGGKFIVVSDKAEKIHTLAVENDQIGLVDEPFWRSGNPWNDDLPAECTTPMGSVFNAGGRWSYVSRYSAVQKINFTGCYEASPGVPQ